MAREDAIEILESEKNRFSHKFQPYDVETREKWQGAYDMAIKALEQEPCEDCVSREDVLKGRTYTSTEEGWEGYTIDEDYVKSLPSVQPNREKHDEEVITEVLDKIKADVEQYQADCDLSCSDDANCRTCDRITFDSIYRIIDKYRKGDKK